MDRTSFRMAAAVVAATASLVACGGGGGGGSNVEDPAAPDPLAGPPPQAGLDSGRFVAFVKALVTHPDETREPAPLDGFTPPGEDTAEPEPAT